MRPLAALVAAACLAAAASVQLLAVPASAQGAALEIDGNTVFRSGRVQACTTCTTSKVCMDVPVWPPVPAGQRLFVAVSAEKGAGSTDAPPALLAWTVGPARADGFRACVARDGPGQKWDGREAAANLDDKVFLNWVLVQIDDLSEDKKLGDYRFGKADLAAVEPARSTCATVQYPTFGAVPALAWLTAEVENDAAGPVTAYGEGLNADKHVVCARATTPGTAAFPVKLRYLVWKTPSLVNTIAGQGLAMLATAEVKVDAAATTRCPTVPLGRTFAGTPFAVCSLRHRPTDGPNAHDSRVCYVKAVTTTSVTVCLDEPAIEDGTGDDAYLSVLTGYQNWPQPLPLTNVLRGGRARVSASAVPAGGVVCAPVRFSWPFKEGATIRVIASGASLGAGDRAGPLTAWARRITSAGFEACLYSPPDAGGPAPAAPAASVPVPITPDDYVSWVALAEEQVDRTSTFSSRVGQWTLPPFAKRSDTTESFSSTMGARPFFLFGGLVEPEPDAKPWSAGPVAHNLFFGSWGPRGARVRVDSARPGVAAPASVSVHHAAFYVPPTVASGGEFRFGEVDSADGYKGQGACYEMTFDKPLNSAPAYAVCVVNHLGGPAGGSGWDPTSCRIEDSTAKGLRVCLAELPAFGAGATAGSEGVVRVQYWAGSVFDLVPPAFDGGLAAALVGLTGKITVAARATKDGQLNCVLAPTAAPPAAAPVAGADGVRSAWVVGGAAELAFGGVPENQPRWVHCRLSDESRPAPLVSAKWASQGPFVAGPVLLAGPNVTRHTGQTINFSAGVNKPGFVKCRARLLAPPSEESSAEESSSEDAASEESSQEQSESTTVVGKTVMKPDAATKLVSHPQPKAAAPAAAAAAAARFRSLSDAAAPVATAAAAPAAAPVAAPAAPKAGESSAKAGESSAEASEESSSEESSGKISDEGNAPGSFTHAELDRDNVVYNGSINAAAPLVITVTKDGNYVVDCYAGDRFGHASPVGSSAPFVIDSTAPQAGKPAVVSRTPASAPRVIAFTTSTSEAGLLRCRVRLSASKPFKTAELDAAPDAEFRSPSRNNRVELKVTVKSDGTYAIDCYVRDAAALLSEVSSSGPIAMVTPPPPPAPPAPKPSPAAAGVKVPLVPGAPHLTAGASHGVTGTKGPGRGRGRGKRTRKAGAKKQGNLKSNQGISHEGDDSDRPTGQFHPELTEGEKKWMNSVELLPRGQAAHN